MNMDNKILLEELKRIKYISNYNLMETSEENKKIISERWAFRDFLSTTRGTEVVRGELESILKQGGLEIKTTKSALGGERILTKTEDVLRALKADRVAESSVAELKSLMMKNTKDFELMDSIANDIVHSEKFIEEYAHLSHSQIKQKLRDSKMKLPKESEQTRRILNAHDAKLAEDARNAGRKPPVEDDFFRETESLREPKPYNSEREWQSYEKMKSPKERVTEFRKRYPKAQIARDAKTAPKKLLENLKKAGLLVWKAGGWVISNFIWILIFGGLAYAVWKNWSRITGVTKDCGEGMVEDPETGECVKAGTSSSDDNDNLIDNRIRDEQGNTYDPCTGVYKIGCVTTDGKKENGNDYISQAQECLGLSPTGMFNKELENKLYSKINKRSFTKADLSLICMAGGTLAAL